MALAEYLLGFDARVAWPRVPGTRADASPSEPDIRLVAGVAEPFSVDPAAWPSVFAGPDRVRLPAEVARAAGLTGRLRLPGWIGPNWPCWSDVRLMMATLGAQRDLVPSSYDVVAVTWHENDPEMVSAANAGPHVLPTEPRGRDASWRLLGYDVAEAARENGIAGSVGSQDWMAVAGRGWRQHLNAHCLYRAAEPAWQLAVRLRERYPEDVPACVFGLWLVRRVRRRDVVAPAAGTRVAAASHRGGE